MLWTVFAILLILWLLGFGFHVGGGLEEMYEALDTDFVSGLWEASRGLTARGKTQASAYSWLPM